MSMWSKKSEKPLLMGKIAEVLKHHQSPEESINMLDGAEVWEEITISSTLCEEGEFYERDAFNKKKSLTV